MEWMEAVEEQDVDGRVALALRCLRSLLGVERAEEMDMAESSMVPWPPRMELDEDDMPE